MNHQAWQSFIDEHPDPIADADCAGIAYVPELGVAAFRGPDVRRFLQGYLTCDTAALDADRFTPAAICSLKGRVVVNGWCLASAQDEVLFVIHASLLATLEDLLKVYLRFSRTRLLDLRDSHIVLAGMGLDASAGGTPIDVKRRFFICPTQEEARRLWTLHAHLPAAAWSAALIRDGLGLVSAETTDRFLPQMLDLHTQGAISFNKGCYLGQEVVARAQHRGQVKRHLQRLAWHGPTRPAAGSALADSAGRQRGMVVQSVGEGDQGLVLAVVQDESTYPLSAGATSVTVPA